MMEQMYSPLLIPKIAVAVDPVALITTECITVTSAMRKHARWAQSSVAAILGGTSAGYGNSTVYTPPAGPGRTLPASSERGKSKDDGHGIQLVQEIGLASRWGLRGKRGKSIQDNPLIAGFTKLRSDLINCKDIRTFDLPSLLHPFLQVIRSSSTSGPITSLALIAITKFFTYHFITRDSPRLPLAMQLLSSTITHCRFEASDSAQDEVVLLRILKLMELMFSGPGGDVLGDESVCEMMETILSMCCQMRLSEMLRKSAEMSMVAICQVVFQRLKTLETEAGNYAELEKSNKDNMDSVKMEPSVNGDSLTNTTDDLLPEEKNKEAEGQASNAENIDGGGVSKAPSEASEDADIRPYSLPSMRELLRVLAEILDPHNRTHTDTMRVMALRIIDVAFEVAGPSIAQQPSLAGLAKDDLCRHLFQLVRYDNMNILQEALRVTGTLLATTRSILKLQQELYLAYIVACLHPRVEIPREPGIDPILYEGVPTTPKLIKPTSQNASGRSTPVNIKERQKLGLEGGNRRPDAREAMVESIGALARIPTFMVELYVNYDCDVDRNDLCEDIVGFLSRNAFPDSATWSTTNVPPLCLDALLGYVGFVAERLDDPPKSQGFADPVELRKQKELKQTIIAGAAKFNEDPKKGIAYLGQQGIIDDINDPASIVKFFKRTSRLNKTLLGEYLSKRSNEKLLDAFMETFDFRGKRADEALRELLGTFRLPGEAALIERIAKSFSDHYYNQGKPDRIADTDAVYVLTYAVIMLNTDQHNQNIKNMKRMTAEDFARNLRGTNGGKDFPTEYLQQIFTAIKTKEIILPDEHDNKDAFDYAWKELLLRTELESDLIVCDTNIYDADMFACTWKPIIATLSYVFMSATDDTVFSRVIQGFDQCSRIAAAYGLTECLDRLVQNLSIISTLASEAPPSTALNTELQVNDNKIMVSELSVKFGRDFKAQLATVVMFRVISGNEQVLRSGWGSIIRCWLNLFVNSLIPAFFSPSQNSLELPEIPLQTPSVVIDRNAQSRESSLLSTLSSYLTSYASDEPPEPSEEEIESTLCTIDCINSCFLGDIFVKLRQLDIICLTCLVETLLAQLPEENTPCIILKPDPATLPPNAPTFIDRPIKYDPAVVYVLELATYLVLRDEDTIRELGKQLAEALQSIIRGAAFAHHVVVSRTIYYLLSLLRESQEYTFLRTPVVLHIIATLERGTFEKSAPLIVKGILKCVKGPTSLKSEMIISPDFWSLLRMLLLINETAQEVFDIVDIVVTDSPFSISSDNYVAIVTLLNDFASAGSVGSIFEQKQDKLARRGGKIEKLKNRPDAEIVARSKKAVAMIQQLTSRVPALISQSHLEKNKAWTTYWSPIFQSLSSQCVNPCREVRHQAFNSLQRCLLLPDLTSRDHRKWTDIFGDVLFPLINRLLKPEVYQSDPRGMGETRMQAAALLCKVFLHYLVMLSEWEGMLDLWLKILDLMDRLMNSGQGDNLEEAIPESLKNVLLVMSSGGYLVPPFGVTEEAHKDLWEQTWKRLNRFLPELYTELYPEAPPLKEASASAPPSDLPPQEAEMSKFTQEDQIAEEAPGNTPAPEV